LEIIRFEIFPYLDWNNRNAVNMCLPPIDRIRTPLAKDYGIKLAIILQSIRVKYYLTKLEKINIKDSNRKRMFLKLFRSLDNMSYIMKYRNDFRTTVFDKCKNYTNINHPEYSQSSKYFKKTLSKVCLNFLEVCEAKYPFMYHVNIDIRTWNCIQDRYVEKESWRIR